MRTHLVDLLSRVTGDPRPRHHDDTYSIIHLGGGGRPIPGQHGDADHLQQDRTPHAGAGEHTGPRAGVRRSTA